MNPDDERLGQLFRLLRVRQGLTQEEISIATAIPVRDVRDLETGRISRVAYGRARRLFAEVDARARLAVWWKGAAADRLLDHLHATLVEASGRLMGSYAWQSLTEVTYSEFGERGSIDLFGHRRELSAVAVCEVTSAFGSLEEPICQQRFGWTPQNIARLLIVPDLTSTRGVVAAHGVTMDTLYPARGREIRRWLRRPQGSLGGIWFVSNPRNTEIDPLPEP